MRDPKGQIRFVHVLGSLDYGGTERRCLGIVAAHDARSIESHVVVLGSTTGGLSEQFKSVPGLTIHECRYNPSARLRFVLQFRELCRDIRPDVVCCYAFGNHALVSIAARLAGVPRVVASVGNPPPADPKLRRRTRWLAQLARPFCETVIAPSIHVGKTVQSGYGLPGRSIRVIHTGCDWRSISEQASKTRSLGRLNGNPVIGMVARLDTIKDHATLIRATAILKDRHPGIRILLVGDGPERSALEQLARSIGVFDQVEFLGARSDVPHYLGLMDVFAFSTTAAEGFSNALLEAMASGTPIVATRVDPCSEALNDGECGLLVNKADPEALAAGIEELLSSPPTASTLSRNALARVRSHHDLNVVASRYEQEFRRGL